MKPHAFGLSDIGRLRETNEDSFLVDPVLGLYAVADGMGGHAAGEIASRLATHSLEEAMRRVQRDGEPPPDVEEARSRMRGAIAEANQRICESIKAHDERRGMGTTMVALLALPRQAVIGHVGDSRAYLLRAGQLQRLTSDHSWVNEQVKQGLLSEREAHRHPMRNIVTRALGCRLDVELDLTEEPFRRSDVFLLCSDGLNAMVSDEEIREMLLAHQSNPEEACRALVKAANELGGEDNTTVVVLSVA